MAKREMLAFLETRPEDELGKILAWAINTAFRLDDKTPYEDRSYSTAVKAQFLLEKK